MPLFKIQEEAYAWQLDRLRTAQAAYDKAYTAYHDPSQGWARSIMLQRMRDAAALMGTINGGVTGGGKGAAGMAVCVTRGRETKRPTIWFTTKPLIGNTIAELLERGQDEARLRLGPLQIVPIMGSPKEKLASLERIKALAGVAYIFAITNPEAVLPPASAEDKKTYVSDRDEAALARLPGMHDDADDGDDDDEDDYGDAVDVQRKVHEALVSINWSVMACDEFQRYMSSPGTRAYRHIFKTIRADWRIGMSATPFPYKPRNFVAALNIFQPGVHTPSVAAFCRDHFVMEGDRVKRTLPNWPAKWDDLREKLLFTYEMDAVTELPPVTFVHEKVQLYPEQRKLYNGLRDHMRMEWEDEARRKVEFKIANKLVQIMRLKQAATDPRMIQMAAKRARGDDRDMLRAVSYELRPGETSAKVDRIVYQFMHELNKDERGVVYSQWSTSIHLLVDDFTRQGVTADFLTGEVGSNVIMHEGGVWSPKLAKCHDFNYGLTELMAINDAAAEGINLQRANHIWLLDLPWRPDKIWQAIGRVRRPIPDKMLPLIGGKPLPVVVHLCIAEDTLEEKLLLPRLLRSARAAGFFTRGQDIFDRPESALFTGIDIDQISMADRDALMSAF